MGAERRRTLVRLLTEVEHGYQQPSWTGVTKKGTEAIKQLIAEFPEEVQSWGGAGTLQNLHGVHRILRHLRTPALPEAERLRRVVLISMLKRLARCHADADGRSLGWSLLFGLPVAVLLGWLVGEATYSNRHPFLGFPNAFGSGPVDWTANLTGIFTGVAVLLVFLFVAVGLRESRRPLARQQSRELIEEIAREYPEEVKSWGGTTVLRSRDAIRTIVQNLQETLP
jgi:hypothetical protein